MGERESNSANARHDLFGNAAPRAAAEAARTFAQAAGLHDADADRLCILVEELVANVVEHGDAATAQLGLARMGGTVCIDLADTGTPFDIRNAPPRTTPKARGGGAGLDIIRAWAEVESYVQEVGTNHLKLVMPLRETYGTP